MTGFYTHRKTLRLRARIGDDAFWVPPRLWAFCAESQPDGDISNYTPEELAELIGYKRDAQAMLQALKDCGYVTSECRIHDWTEYNGFHSSLSERAKKAANARWKKDREKDTESERESKQALLKHPQAMLEASTHPPDAQIPSWQEWWGYVQMHHPMPEWKAREAFDTCSEKGWEGVRDWQARVRRVFGWWEGDGRPMVRPVNGKHAPERPLSLLDLRTIMQAKESEATQIRSVHYSQTAMGGSWDSDTHKKRYFALKGECKRLNAKIGSMA